MANKTAITPSRGLRSPRALPRLAISAAAMTTKPTLTRAPLAEKGPGVAETFKTVAKRSQTRPAGTTAQRKPSLLLRVTYRVATTKVGGPMSAGTAPSNPRVEMAGPKRKSVAIMAKSQRLPATPLKPITPRMNPARAGSTT